MCFTSTTVVHDCSSDEQLRRSTPTRKHHLCTTYNNPKQRPVSGPVARPRDDPRFPRESTRLCPWDFASTRPNTRRRVAKYHARTIRHGQEVGAPKTRRSVPLMSRRRPETRNRSSDSSGRECGRVPNQDVFRCTPSTSNYREHNYSITITHCPLPSLLPLPLPLASGGPLYLNSARANRSTARRPQGIPSSTGSTGNSENLEELESHTPSSERLAYPSCTSSLPHVYYLLCIFRVLLVYSSFVAFSWTPPQGPLCTPPVACLDPSCARRVLLFCTPLL